MRNKSAVLGIAALLTGCSGGGSSPPADPGLQAAFVEAFCATQVTCCAQAQVPIDVERCRGQIAKKTGFNAAAAQACMAELSTGVPRSRFWCQNLAEPDLHVCAQVFGWPGTKSAGEGCAKDQDCAPSPMGRVTCRGEVLTEENRRCLVVVRGREGDGPCVDAFTREIPARVFSCDLYEGLFCDSRTDTCKKLVPAGSPCSDSGPPCEVTTYCQRTDDGRKCAPRVPVGESCCAEMCESASCVLGASCSGQTMLCVPHVPVGEACSPTNCSTGNCLNGICTRSEYDVATRCAQP